MMMMKVMMTMMMKCHLLVSSRIPRCVNLGESSIWVPFTINWQEFCHFTFGLFALQMEDISWFTYHMRGQITRTWFKMRNKTDSTKANKHSKLVFETIFLSVLQLENDCIGLPESYCPSSDTQADWNSPAPWKWILPTYLAVQASSVSPKHSPHREGNVLCIG